MPDLVALRQLRRVVENAPEELLHMNAVVEEASCGTARCALGWCLVDPWFMENTPLGAFHDWPSTYVDGDAGTLTQATTETFDLSREDRYRLFGLGLGVNTDPHAVSKAQVLKNIDRLLAGEAAFTYKLEPPPRNLT